MPAALFTWALALALTAPLSDELIREGAHGPTPACHIRAAVRPQEASQDFEPSICIHQ